VTELNPQDQARELRKLTRGKAIIRERYVREKPTIDESPGAAPVPDQVRKIMAEANATPRVIDGDQDKLNELLFGKKAAPAAVVVDAPEPATAAPPAAADHVEEPTGETRHDTPPPTTDDTSRDPYHPGIDWSSFTGSPEDDATRELEAKQLELLLLCGQLQRRVEDGRDTQFSQHFVDETLEKLAFIKKSLYVAGITMEDLSGIERELGRIRGLLDFYNENLITPESESLAGRLPTAFRELGRQVKGGLNSLKERLWPPSPEEKKKRVWDLIKFLLSTGSMFTLLTATKTNSDLAFLSAMGFESMILATLLTSIGVQEKADSIEANHPRVAKLLCKMASEASVAASAMKFGDVAADIFTNPWLQGFAAGAASYGLIHSFPTQVTSHIPAVAQEHAMATGHTPTISTEGWKATGNFPLHAANTVPTIAQQASGPVGESFTNLSTVMGHEIDFARDVIGASHPVAVGNALKNVAWGLANGKDIGAIGPNSIVNLFNRDIAVRFGMAVDDVLKNAPDAAAIKNSPIYDLIRASTIRPLTADEVRRIVDYFASH
jgi:hypothetical protein